MDSEEQILILNKNKHKRKIMISSEDDELEKKQKLEIKYEQTNQDKKEEVSQNKQNLQQQIPNQDKDNFKVQKQQVQIENQSDNNAKNLKMKTQDQSSQKIQLSKEKQKVMLPGQITKPKNNIVYDILKRWWYCMEDWPPQNYDYDNQLKEKGYRNVDYQNWRKEQDFDDSGMMKVFQIKGYIGLYRNNYGEIVDVRPKELCPSFENLKQKSLRELFELLIKAYKNQIIEYKEIQKELQNPQYLKYLDNQLQKSIRQQKALLEKIQSIKSNRDNKS